MNDHCGLTPHHPLPHLHETTGRLPGTPGQPQKFHHAPTQTGLNLNSQIFGHRYLPPCRPRKHAALAGLFYHIPLGAQPYSPSGQSRVQVRHNNR
ncbi:hypothetical protein AA0312_1729 [Acetobacter tropicalis NRIC 0312]|nr:hypothetical protein AA0312_1729 [Acetobacter tropicalis NRIC 0312]